MEEQQPQVGFRRNPDEVGMHEAGQWQKTESSRKGVGNRDIRGTYYHHGQFHVASWHQEEGGLEIPVESR